MGCLCARCPTHASTSCWPPMLQWSLRRKPIMNSSLWRKSPCPSSSLLPWWWSAIHVTASTWHAAWCIGVSQTANCVGRGFFGGISWSTFSKANPSLVYLPVNRHCHRRFKTSFSKSFFLCKSYMLDLFSSSSRLCWLGMDGMKFTSFFRPRIRWQRKHVMMASWGFAQLFMMSAKEPFDF